MKVIFNLVVIVSGFLCIDGWSGSLVRIWNYAAEFRSYRMTGKDGQYLNPMVASSSLAGKITILGEEIARSVEYSANGTGFVIEISPTLKLLDPELAGYDFKFLYPSDTRFRAVYVLTAAHVWFDILDEVQVAMDQFAERVATTGSRYTESSRFSTFSSLSFYDESGLEVLDFAFARGTTPVARAGNKLVDLSSFNLGVRTLNWCRSRSIGLNPKNTSLNIRAGCDHALVRFIVPESTAEKLTAFSLSTDARDYRPGASLQFRDVDGVGNYKSRQIFKDGSKKDWVIYAEKDQNARSVASGWSGSPLLNRSNSKVVGLLFGSWPGESSASASYLSSSLVNEHGILEKIKSDIESLSESPAPYRPAFYSE